LITYNIPELLVEEYRGNPVIVRTSNPGTVVSVLRPEDLDFLVRIQIHDLYCNLRALIDWEYSGPVEVVLMCPGTEFSALYQITELLCACPVRVVIPVVPGFLKAVRVAASLHCAVKLEVGQPYAALVSELHQALEFYLHGHGVTEPIEFFQGLLTAYVQNAPISLWDIQEDNPFYTAFVCEDGEVRPPGRISRLKAQDLSAERLSAHADCAQCSFAGCCAGYFKWPDPDYACDGVKTLLARITDAAHALAVDIQKHRDAQESTEP
jgi:hypothetical protein